MKKLTLSVIALVLCSACGNSSTGTGSKEDSPIIPNLTATQLSFDYFKGKVAPELQQSTIGGYQLASTLTLVVESIITGFTSLPASFMDLGNNQNASLIADAWTWEYTSSGIGASVSIILTAVEQSTTTDWEMLISASSPDISFNNYKFVDGSVSNSDNSGVWNFYDFEEQSNTPVLTYSWDIVSDNEMDFLITFGDFDYSTMSYVRSNADNTIILSGSGSIRTTIYWNTITGSGYFEDIGQERVCWDDSRLDTPCS